MFYDELARGSSTELQLCWIYSLIRTESGILEDQTGAIIVEACVGEQHFLRILKLGGRDSPASRTVMKVTLSAGRGQRTRTRTEDVSESALCCSRFILQLQVLDGDTTHRLRVHVRVQTSVRPNCGKLR
jgi:hypothetical protein